MKCSIPIVALVFLLFTPCARAAGEKYALAFPDTYISADPIDTDGDWCGIVASEDKYSLVPMQVTEKPFPYHDGNAGEDKVGVTIAVEGEQKPLVVVRGLGNNAPRALVSRPKAQTFLFPGQSVDVSIRKSAVEREFHIMTSGSVEHNSWSLTYKYLDYQLRLIRGHTSNVQEQVLMSLPEFSSFGSPQIVFAGDLDGDGKPDFIVNRQQFYTDTNLALFLSSAAKEGELVGLVAEWKAMQGC